MVVIGVVRCELWDLQERQNLRGDIMKILHKKIDFLHSRDFKLLNK